MRYSLALICVPLLAVAAACGTGVQYADSSRFQDGIYYKGTDPVPFTPKSSDELKREGELQNFASRSDTLTIIADEVNIYETDPFWRSYLYFGYPSAWSWYSWHSPWNYWYSWDPYWAWYDPWYSPYYYDAWWGGWYGYWGRPLPGPMHYAGNAVYTPRRGSATSGTYSRSRVPSNRSIAPSGRSSSSSISRSRGNRTTSFGSGENYSPSATRRSSSASYNNGSQVYRRGSSASGSGVYRGGSSSSSGGFSRGGGFSGGSSHSGSGSVSRGGRR